MAIQLDTIENLRAKMKDAPEVEKSKREVSKQVAIKELKKEIELMQKKGYTLEDISKFLTEGGLEISTPTLKSYLQRTKTDAKPKVGRAKKLQSADPIKTKQVSDKKHNQQPAPAQKGGFEVRPDSDI